MEAGVVNFCSPGDRVLVIEAGKFGERWREIAESHLLKVISLKAEYGDVISKEVVRSTLKKNKDVKAVFGTLCETSTGALFDIQGIAAQTKGTDAIFVVDAISGLASDRLEMDAWGVDVVVSGSQKGLMLPPGLAFLAANEKARKRIKEAKCPRYYVDLLRYDSALQKQDTPFTPAITIVLALRVVLDKILAEGMEGVWSRTERLAKFVRRRVHDLGLELFTNHLANTLTALKVPGEINGEELISVMRDQRGVTIAGGQGSMSGKVMRIAHFGLVSEKDLGVGLRILEKTLKEFQAGSKSVKRLKVCK